MSYSENIRVDLHFGHDALARAEDDWRRLKRIVDRPRVWQSIEWWRSYVNCLNSADDAACVFVLHDAQGVLAIIPTIYRQLIHYGVTYREFTLPKHNHIPMNDILLRAGADIKAVFLRLQDYLKEECQLKWDCLCLKSILQDSPLLSLAGYPATLLMVQKEGDYIQCGSKFEEHMKSLSSNFRAQLRKSKNRCQKEYGELPKFVCAREPDEIRHYFKEFLRVEASGWKGAAGSGTAIALDPQLTRFYADVLEGFLPDRNVSVNCMIVQGTVVAAQFCLLDDDTIYSLKIGYDEQWARLSPGHLLLENLFKTSAESGRFQYVNLISRSAWQTEWKPERFVVYDLYCFNRTFSGFLMSARKPMLESAKRAYRKLRQRAPTLRLPLISGKVSK